MSALNNLRKKRNFFNPYLYDENLKEHKTKCVVENAWKKFLLTMLGIQGIFVFSIAFGFFILFLFLFLLYFYTLLSLLKCRTPVTSKIQVL